MVPPRYIALALLLALSLDSSQANLLQCKKYTLRSTLKHPDGVVVKDSAGTPQTIVSAAVWVQISSVRCVKGKTFIYNGNFLIAKAGCQATFNVCYKTAVVTTPASLTTILPGCEKVRLLSRQARPVSKTLDSDVVSMTLLQNLHDKVLCDSSNFGFSGARVFARDGCRGDFQVCTTGVAPFTTPAPALKCKTVVLKSTPTTSAQQQLRDASGDPVDIESATVINNLSPVRCRLRVTFFVNRSFLLVKKGCSARFRICYRVPFATTAAPFTTQAPVQCKRYPILKPTRKTVRDFNGLPVPITSLELLREISRRVCRKGLNYRFRDSVFTVNGGCKGIFKVCYGVIPPAPLTTPEPLPVCKKITIRSTLTQPGRREITDPSGNPAHIVHVHVWDQISAIKCVRGKNYFVFKSSIVTKFGCYATFKVCYISKTPKTPASITTTVTPSPGCDFVKLLSRRNRPAFVAYDDATVSSMTLIREFGRVDCVRGRTFGFRRSRAFARRGCRGVFEICLEPAALTTTPAPPPDIPVCEKIDVKSTLTRPGHKVVTDASGNPAHIVHVHVWDQISAIKCVRGKNYFVFKSSIVTKFGCKATFKVCYISKTPTTPAPITTQAPEVCKVHKVLRPTRKTIVDGAGNPVAISRLVLVREISRGVCRRNVNYFARGSRFVVIGGCKGVFRICYENVVTTIAPFTTTPATPVCEKIDVKSTLTRPGRKVVTDASGNPAHIVHVHVWDQISAIKCVRGKNYFVFKSSIVTKFGCYATFKVCYISKTPTTPAPITTTVAPEKCKTYFVLKHFRKRIRDANNQPATITRFRLRREISNNVCRRGSNFFSRGSLFVVTGGCKGVFRVCYQNAVVTQAPLTTPSPVKVCKKIDVKSKKNKPARKTITDANGNPVHVVHVHVWDQISAIKCVEWVNYFYSDSYIIAKKGCQATFKVCYETVPTTAAPLTTTPEPETCKRHTILVPTRKVITGNNGLPATITRLYLAREISNKVCQRGVNYFFAGSILVVNGGCKGVFRLCYSNAPAPITTLPPPVGNCKEIVVKSTLFQPGRADVRDSFGNPVHIVSVQLTRQISVVTCVQWLNYFYGHSYVVTKFGCSAAFRVCYEPKVFVPTTPPNQITTAAPEPKCRKFTLTGPTTREVRDSRNQPAVIVSLTLKREFSKDKCLSNRFSFSGATITVLDGCTAVFQVCYLPAPPPTTAALTTPNTVTCRAYTITSTVVRKFKDANGDTAKIVSVELKREVKNGRCRKGLNFFFRGVELTVKGICKGVFIVCIKPFPATVAPLTTTPATTPLECKHVSLDGSAGTDSKTIVSSSGRPVVIKSIFLKAELSFHVCKEWVNFFASGNTVVAKNGCSGLFKVCFAVL